MSNQRYMMRGVSASKEDVHNAIKNIDKGLCPAPSFRHWQNATKSGIPTYCAEHVRH